MSYKEVKIGKIHKEKRNFHTSKESDDINDINIENILVSNKYPSGK